MPIEFQSLEIFVLAGAIMGKSIELSLKTSRRKVRNFAKWAIGALYLCLGAPGRKSALVAFVFHEVGDNPSDHARLTNTYSTEKIFSKQIDLLSSHFQFIDPLVDSQWIDKAGCLITFDDGYKGSLTAARKLEVLGITSIHFLNLETIYGGFNASALLHYINLGLGKDSNWSDSNPRKIDELLSGLSNRQIEDLNTFSGPYMNPTELKELISLKRTMLGDHLLNHWYANSLTENEFRENLSRYSERFEEALEMKRYFAAPHGQLDLKKIQHLSRDKYEVIFSGSSRMQISGTHIIPRIDMNNSIKSRASLFGAIAILNIRGKRKIRS